MVMLRKLPSQDDIPNTRAPVHVVRNKYEQTGEAKCRREHQIVESLEYLAHASEAEEAQSFQQGSV
jgi:hypothetical protein